MKLNILFFFILFLCICCVDKSKSSSGLVSDSVVCRKDLIRKYYIKDSTYILSMHPCRLLGGSFVTDITPDEIASFFMNGEIISDQVTVDIIEENTYDHYICGQFFLNGDTLPYYISPSGVGFYDLEKESKYGKESCSLKYIKNQINLPKDKYRKSYSEINIINYEKNLFDFSIWEIWKQEYPDYHVDGDDQYVTLKRWNEKVYVNEMNSAFNLCKKTTDAEIDYLFDVNPYCYASGYLLKNNRVYYFIMNGGGVFYLFLSNQDSFEREVYGCFTPEGLRYFTDYLKWPDE